MGERKTQPRLTVLQKARLAIYAALEKKEDLRSLPRVFKVGERELHLAFPGEDWPGRFTLPRQEDDSHRQFPRKVPAVQNTRRGDHPILFLLSDPNDEKAKTRIFLSKNGVLTEVID